MCPPMGFENDSLQMTEITNALRSAKPDLVYSCFGFPKDPLVISALRPCLPSAWFLGLGGSLAIVSGRTRRAPHWMQSDGYGVAMAARTRTAASLSTLHRRGHSFRDSIALQCPRAALNLC